MVDHQGDPARGELPQDVPHAGAPLHPRLARGHPAERPRPHDRPQGHEAVAAVPAHQHPCARAVADGPVQAPPTAQDQGHRAVDGEEARRQGHARPLGVGELLDEEVAVPPALLGEAPLEVREEEFDVHAPTLPHDGAQNKSMKQYENQ